VRLAAQTLLTKIALAFAFALVEGCSIVVLTAIFGNDAARPRALARSCCRTRSRRRSFAPFVFRLAERVHRPPSTCRPGRGDRAMSLFVQRSDVSEFRKRFRLDRARSWWWCSDPLGALFQLQILEGRGEPRDRKENIVRRVTLATTRGDHPRSRTGGARRSRPSYNVYVVPSRLDMRSRGPSSPSTSGSAVEERARLESQARRPRPPTAAQGPADPAEGGRVAGRRRALQDPRRRAAGRRASCPCPCASTRRRGRRARARLHGRGRRGEARRAALAGYIEGDRLGATGIERAWESYLRGTRGWEKVLVDARGRTAPGRHRSSTSRPRVDPIPGRDLRLTIDATLQKAIEKAMRGELAGGVAVVDVRTGRILGLYSKPELRSQRALRRLGQAGDPRRVPRLYSDPLKPALDKTLAGAYPPGSTFKPFTALAALEKGLIDPRMTIQCRGGITFGKRTFRCTHVHGATDLHKAIAESCNVYFFRSRPSTASAWTSSPRWASASASARRPASA
jgi:penicillin-binding protein 2